MESKYFDMPFKKLTKIVGLRDNSSHIFFKKFSILIQCMERPAKTKLFPAKLCAELANFRFSTITFSDSAQANTVRSPTLCSVSLRGVTYFSNISAKKKKYFSLLIRGLDGFDS